MSLPSSVLFACTHNAIRSPMAEALLRHRHGSRIYVDSLGLQCGDQDPFTVAVMDEIGIDIRRHSCKTFNQWTDMSFDLVVTFSPEAHHNALEMTRAIACDVEYWKVADPSYVDGNRETRLAAYRETRDLIAALIAERFPVIALAAG